MFFLSISPPDIYYLFPVGPCVARDVRGPAMSKAELKSESDTASQEGKEEELASSKVVYNKGRRHPIGTCDSCTTSKVSCSRELPTCSRCLRLGVACVYPVSRRTKPDNVEDPEANTFHDSQITKAIAMLRLQGKLSPLKVQKML